jgi:ketopantoate reductase
MAKIAVVGCGAMGSVYAALMVDALPRAIATWGRGKGAHVIRPGGTPGKIAPGGRA